MILDERCLYTRFGDDINNQCEELKKLGGEIEIILNELAFNPLDINNANKAQQLYLAILYKVRCLGTIATSIEEERKRLEALGRQLKSQQDNDL